MKRFITIMILCMLLCSCGTSTQDVPEHSQQSSSASDSAAVVSESPLITESPAATESPTITRNPVPTKRAVHAEKVTPGVVVDETGKKHKLKLGDIDLEKKLTYSEAFYVLCGTTVKNPLTKKRIRGDKLRRSIVYKKIKDIDDIKKSNRRFVWGIYADSKVAAKTLVFGTGCNDKPEVHQYGGYGHYHDSHHLIHIWFGSPMKRIYEEQAFNEIKKGGARHGRRSREVCIHQMSSQFWT